MYKKFVPLNATQSPTKNPYEVRTYMGEPLKSQHPEWRTENCGYDRHCDSRPQIPDKRRTLTLEEEIRKIHRRTRANIYTKRCNNAKCQETDSYLTCVMPQRSPKDLKRHGVLREKYLHLQRNMGEYVHDVNDIYSVHANMIKLESPPGDSDEDDRGEWEGEEEGETDIRPQLASPECSMELLYVPTQRILELQRPKSGVYINESEPPNFYPTDGIPFSTYNPRVLQQQFDNQQLKKIDIITGRTSKDLWTWNLGLQQRESDLDRRFIDAAVHKFDCNNAELMVYKIPNDLEKTFRAQVVFGSRALTLETLIKKKGSYNRPKEMACLFVAFVESFRLNADFWTMETLDNILKMADKLIAKSHKMNYKSPGGDYDIIPQIQERQAELDLKLHFKGALRCEPNIYKAMSLYFNKYNACVLCSAHLYLLIWKRCKNSYYIFDPNGRAENCERDFENGRCSLISTNFVEHLVHLVVNISQANMDEEFRLYEIYLKSFGKIPEPLAKKPQPKTLHKLWIVVNESFALIPGCNNGLFQPNSDLIPNPSMLISVMAILYALIERPMEWQSDTVDELIRLGTAYYKSLRRKLKLKDNQQINVNDLPDKYVLGTFKASLKKAAFFYTGTVNESCKKFMDSLLAFGLKGLFDAKWEAALIQIDNSVVSTWRDGELFYVYDPFRRGKVGQVLDPEDYMSKGYAVLQMHSNFESLLKILHEKALQMRRGGKLFLHAINVGCIKPIMDGKTRKLRYPKLKLTPETYKAKKSKKTKKDKKDKKKLERVCSIESLKEHERIPLLEDSEIIEHLAEAIVCEIIDSLPESAVDRPKLYKPAGQVLLRSDQEYLQQLKYMVQHDQDYDNVHEAFPTHPPNEPPMISLEEELASPSNFQSLSDGTWIILGSQKQPRLDEEQTKVKGLLSCLVTFSLTGRYKISSWTSQLIDYALNSTTTFEEDFQSYQYLLGAILSSRIPSLCLGHRSYELKVQRIIKSDLKKPLRHVLLDCLIDYNRILVICQQFSCVLVKRYNFLYMFIGYPVTPVGYRQFKKAPGCLLRSVELDSLIKRIEFGCNPQGCEITNYVVIPFKVFDITDEEIGRYRPWPRNVEERMYQASLNEQQKRDASKKFKLEFLNNELLAERERLEEFQMAKARAKPRKTKWPRNIETSSEMEADEEDDHTVVADNEYEDDNVSLPTKHKFGSHLAELKEPSPPQPLLYGYHLRHQDYLFKIQGSKFLEGRDECLMDEIKPCFFASTLAILYAILKPHNQWTSQRIDQVIDSTLILCTAIDDFSNSSERIVKNISADDYTFDIWIKVFQPLGLIGDLGQQIERANKLRKYLLLQTSNCTYAICKDTICKDTYYHLFDPYPSMHVLDKMQNGDGDEVEEDDGVQRRKMRPKAVRGIKRYRERNAASWILFADLKSMVYYMDQRACSPSWKENKEYSFLVLDIISYKKSPLTANMLQLLTGVTPCNIPGEEETAICAHHETPAWLEHCLPIWSRLNRRNSAGVYRGAAVAKYKKFDIEIDNRLWSLWGNLHPQAAVFDSNNRGKQYLACCVMALCATRLYRLVDWSSALVDSIIINGDRYHAQSIADIQIRDYEMRVEDLDIVCQMDNVKFEVHLEPLCYGKLYSRPNCNRMNLAEALLYFFRSHHNLGLLQCSKKCLAFGRLAAGPDGGYFMFDCQSRDHPLFAKGQGAAYVLRTKYLQILLYCLVVTLNIPYYNVQFMLYKVEALPENASVEEEDGEAGGTSSNQNH
ncbi:uncharacterized protein LOC133335359 [Musca vetustissima]|uniref:uncharacterized protein LOC133335359 n=1 Tax=Musca vetustissima TaxID=27455 RepID=UPI002AB68F51|nr:uncharacterized protein LOC133335359 [Musca vetustissima]